MTMKKARVSKAAKAEFLRQHYITIDTTIVELEKEIADLKYTSDVWKKHGERLTKETRLERAAVKAALALAERRAQTAEAYIGVLVRKLTEIEAEIPPLHQTLPVGVAAALGIGLVGAGVVTALGGAIGPKG